MKRPLKYAPLASFLESQPLGVSQLTMSFEEIRKLLSSPLPASAGRYSAWWLDRSAATTHVQAHAWMDAGWRIDAGDLDLRGRTVTFRRD